ALKPSQAPSALIEMIENSPDLRELQLKLSADMMSVDDLDRPWWPAELFRCLKNPLTRLRRLEVGGTYAIDWVKFLDGLSECHLRRFFEQHPLLHTVGFLWSERREMDLIFEPHQAEQLFAGVRNFTAPIAVCAGVVASRLAEQLEDLKISWEITDPPRPYRNTFDTLASVIRPLPKLTGLSLSCYNLDAVDIGVLNTGTLDTILAASPNLRSLLVGVPFDW
ncbi:hypothetical protein FRC11_002572, partial [Ceratobasidium sp. 423]